MIGFTVVGKPPATVITSSPGFSRRSPSVGDVRAVTASKLADEPELTSVAVLIPNQRANCFSNCAANRPVVSQKSNDESTNDCTSPASNTLPDTGTRLSPGTNGFEANAASWYSLTKSRM